jgi:hypothetical protein
MCPRGRYPTKELQPQRRVLPLALPRERDFVPVETADSFDHPLNGSIRFTLAHQRLSKPPHYFGYLYSREVVVFRLYPPVPPFTSGSPKMSRCCARARRRGGTTGVLDWEEMDVGEPTSSGPTEPVVVQTGMLPVTHRRLPSTGEEKMGRGESMPT